MTAPRTPVVFIHGLWLHATTWTPWLELFTQAGYNPIAPGWPGEPDTAEQARKQPELVANTSIDDATAHFAKIIDSLDASPVIVGHSFGGLIAEKLLGQGIGAAAVAIDPAQIKGVLPLPLAQLRAALPALGNPANLHKAVSLTQKEFKFGFGNALPEDESAELFGRWAIPAPARPLFQAAAANFSRHSQAKVDTGNQARGPLLTISGAEDHTVPDVVTRSTLKQYRHSTAVTELKQFEHRGHSLTIDSGWKEVAEAVLQWLRAHGILPSGHAHGDRHGRTERQGTRILLRGLSLVSSGLTSAGRLQQRRVDAGRGLVAGPGPAGYVPGRAPAAAQMPAGPPRLGKPPRGR